MNNTFTFDDTLTFMGKTVKELTLDDLYYIYEKYSLFIIIDLINRQIKLETEK